MPTRSAMRRWPRSPATSAPAIRATRPGPAIWRARSPRRARPRTDEHRLRPQRPPRLDRGRADHAAALRAAWRDGAERGQVRLRPRPVRRLHGAGGRTTGVLLRAAGLGRGGAGGDHRRGARRRRASGSGAGRARGRAGGAVRLLHPRHDDPRPRALEPQPAPERGRGAPGAVAQPLPLRDPRADPARRPPRRSRHGRRRARPGRASRSWPGRTGARVLSAPVASRRALLTGGGVVVAFALAPRAWAQGGEGAGAPTRAPGLPGDLSKHPMLDSWIAIGSTGRATVFTGKAELGQGIKTALTQLAAEELDLPLDAITLVTADTARSPDEGVTAGSHSMQDSGTAILNAAANVRMLLTDAAAAQLGVPAAQLRTEGGAVVTPDGRRVGYGALAARLDLHVAARPDAPLKSPAQFRLIGQSTPRV